jgi:hypothetical protein
MSNTKLSGLLADKDTNFFKQSITLTAGDTFQLTGHQLIEQIVEDVKGALGYLERPLIKCRHCGQWGAVYCACAHCGAPIDP